MHNYQRSLTDPRDKIVLQTQPDDLGDKLPSSSVGAREVLSTQLTDDGPVYHALGVATFLQSQVDSTFDDQYAEAKIVLSSG